MTKDEIRKHLAKLHHVSELAHQHGIKGDLRPGKVLDPVAARAAGEGFQGRPEAAVQARHGAEVAGGKRGEEMQLPRGPEMQGKQWGVAEALKPKQVRKPRVKPMPAAQVTPAEAAAEVSAMPLGDRRMEAVESLPDNVREAAAVEAVKQGDEQTAKLLEPKPPEPYFTGIDANGHKWVNGKQVTIGKEETEADKPTTIQEQPVATPVAPEPTPVKEPIHA